jgi:hypothetical protein
MAFPTSGLTNNLVHKEGNRAFVYDSALGVWDQVRETDRTENKFLQGEIGAGVTGFTGIKEADMWRLATGFTGTADPISSNLERDDTYGFGLLGTGMSQSSGIFTFPSTGYWFISFVLGTNISGDNRYIGASIRISTDSGSSWPESSLNYCFIQQTSGGGTYSSVYTSAIIDVTSTSTIKVKFTTVMHNQLGTVIGGTDTNQTYMQFIRIGDT